MGLKGTTSMTGGWQEDTGKGRRVWNKKRRGLRRMRGRTVISAQKRKRRGWRRMRGRRVMSF